MKQISIMDSFLKKKPQNQNQPQQQQSQETIQKTDSKQMISSTETSPADKMVPEKPASQVSEFKQLINNGDFSY